ncbi:MAG: hypothetical protein EBR54_01775 [Flavobacteriia bacterium]|nr:hypothetical protein [Flavobacteriia bacterium]
MVEPLSTIKTFIILPNIRLKGNIILHYPYPKDSRYFPTDIEFLENNRPHKFSVNMTLYSIEPNVYSNNSIFFAHRIGLCNFPYWRIVFN